MSLVSPSEAREAPPKKAHPPKNVRAEMRVWSAEEARTFLTSVRDDPLYPAFALRLTTGLRRGGLLGVAWRDLDLDGARLHIRQTIVTINFQVEFSTPKTAAGRRVVALGQRTVETLRAHRTARLEERI